ncbi:hypothetical protein HAX54_002181 [Datura stramonium]|uniref:Uncharacterized protein n=1 Tax=Datura stramonium TaxID=4076 RepID=A0ABS8RHM2_DATST|nr:hypothetical protein [Datura stramonium]
MNSSHDTGYENGYLNGDMYGVHRRNGECTQVKPHSSLKLKILARDVAFHYNKEGKSDCAIICPSFMADSWGVSTTIGAFPLSCHLDDRMFLENVCEFPGKWELRIF